MGNAIKSVTSGLCACVLTSTLVVVPPDHSARSEGQTVQLAVFTVRPVAAPRGFFVRSDSGHVRLVVPAAEAVGSVTAFRAADESAADGMAGQSTVNGAASAATIGPTALPIVDDISSIASPILGSIAAVGFAFVFFVVLIPAAFINYLVLSLLDAVGILPLIEILRFGPIPPAAAVPLAVTADVDADC